MYRSTRSRLPRDLLLATVFALIQALFVRTFLVQGFRIPTHSMYPGLQAGDHILVNKFVYNGSIDSSFLLPYREIRRGDVVIFQSPSGGDLIKRCIGLPGDLLEISQHQVWLNGQPIDESGYVAVRDDQAPTEYTVPAHHYFVLGDHRRSSQDSRDFGSAPRNSVKGRGFLIYWSSQSADLDNWDTMETSSRVPSAWFPAWRLRRIGKPIR